MNGIALDIDDVLAETARTAIEHVRGKVGGHPDLTTEQLAYTYHQPGNVPSWKNEEAQEIIRKLFNSESFLRTLPTVVGAQQALKKITQHIPVALYISSRTTNFLDVTKEWLANNDFPDAPVVLRDVETRAPDWKAIYLQANHPEILGIIDDSIDAYIENEWLFPKRFFWLQRNHKDNFFIRNLISATSWEDLSEAVIHFYHSK